jgi:hypothetical protein
MGMHNELGTTMSVIEDGPEAELEFEMYEDDELFDDDLDTDSEIQIEDEDEDDAQESRAQRASLSAGWRRVDLLREEKLLRMALADFNEYDFDFDFDSADYADNDNDASAYS